MNLKNIAETLEARFIVGVELADRNFETVGASDLMSDILTGISIGCVFLTGLTSNQAIQTAVVAGVRAVIFVRDKKPSKEIIERAIEAHIPLLSTRLSMFVSCGRLYNLGLAGLDGRR